MEMDLMDYVKAEKEREEPDLIPSVIVLSRQQRDVLIVIRAAGTSGVTTMELIERSRVCDAPRRARELKRMGLVKEPEYEGRTPSGSSLFRYREV